MHGKIRQNSFRSLGKSLERNCGALALAGDNSTDSFFKDGRKISVGDCALFKPLKDSPPSVGVIRWLALNEENKLQLGVNWLYRTSELKLGRDSLVDTAPNEIFYSFQKNQVPAASLLHPCKVTFLPRGVRLPTGTSSFVCRRAYASSDKSLSWLTDRNYIDDQQEVDQLLFKAKIEMHSARSPKQNDVRISTSQLKPASDSGQNSGNSCPTQSKGKKRERGDRDADSAKRGCVTRPTENNFKYEIEKITDKGGGVNLEGVDKLVELMQSDNRLERKMDLGIIFMFANVLASTDKVDCLNRFLLLKGLPVLNGWLQDIHKGRIGDGNNTKDGDKSVEEFLLVLLHALDKLPVNLQALQMCNIGRSVNRLRSHKNMEIQRKARILVDTWKKRVEAEMISIDAKSGSTHVVSGWPSKSRFPDLSNGGSQTPDSTLKSSITQNSSAKTTSPGESSLKYATSSPDAHQIREDRSSSSNQSHNTKDDQKSSPTGSVTVNKITSSSSRNRKNGGYTGIAEAGSQKETTSSKSSLSNKNTVSEKLSLSAVKGERLVNISNRVTSPAKGVSEQLDHASKVSEVLAGLEGAGSPAVLPDEEQSLTSEDSKRLNEGPVTDKLKSVKFHASSFGPMNALIESCVKYSEGILSVSPEDDAGMNLLASVAAGELETWRSDLVSPSDSTERTTPVVEEVCSGESNGGIHEEKITSSNADQLSIGECKPMVDDSGSKPLEGDFNKFENEVLEDQVIVKAEFAERSSNKDPRQSECGHKSVSEAQVDALIKSRSASIELEETEKSSFSPRATEPCGKMMFNLNEGCSDDDDGEFIRNNSLPFDFDLNVADERVLEEIGSVLAVESTTDVASNSATFLNNSMPLRDVGRLDLDLNAVDETDDTGYCLTTNHHDKAAPIVDVKHVHRDFEFDLNDGPVGDDPVINKLSINQMLQPKQLPYSGLPINNQGPSSNFTSWFSPGNTYSTIAIPSVLPDRDPHPHPFPIFPPNATHKPFSVPQFNPNMYQGSVLSSSPAVPYPSSAFQFPVFPYGTNFPSGNSSSSVAQMFQHSQYVGPVGTVASHFPRPYMVGLADSRGRQGLDLNSGPGPIELGQSGQHSIASFQLAEEQARMFSVSGGVLKRREPEGGWDNEFIRHSRT